jgi:hypothetical protein
LHSQPAWWNALNERIPWVEVSRCSKNGIATPPQSDAVYSSIDPILDKISKFEIGSLTPSGGNQSRKPAAAEEIRVTLWVSRVGFFLLLQLLATRPALQTVFC